MKFTDTQKTELRELCMAEKSNAELAKHFGCDVREIHAARSQMGITIPKVKAMKESGAVK